MRPGEQAGDRARPAPEPARWEVDSHRPLVAALAAHDEAALVRAVDEHFAVLQARPYDGFRAARFRELIDHEEFGVLRALLATRAAATVDAT